MPTTFEPGRLLVDETSRAGSTLLGSGEAAQFPAEAMFSKAVLGWLAQIKDPAVGRLLLNALSNRPVSAKVTIVPCAKRSPSADDATTVPATGPAGQRSITVVYTPPDALGSAISLAPDEHPVPVLTHELMHALMDVHGINTLRDGQGKLRSIIGWKVGGTYPSHTEFLADVVQNMILSERGLVLRDGHGHGDDDPLIVSAAANLQPVAASFGKRAVPGAGVDLARFVASYRAPLAFLRDSPLSGFVASLAALSHVAFNPFAELARHSSAGNVQGAARVPRTH